MDYLERSGIDEFNEAVLCSKAEHGLRGALGGANLRCVDVREPDFHSAVSNCVAIDDAVLLRCPMANANGTASAKNGRTPLEDRVDRGPAQQPQRNEPRRCSQ